MRLCWRRGGEGCRRYTGDNKFNWTGMIGMELYLALCAFTTKLISVKLAIFEKRKKISGWKEIIMQ